jgi:DNA-binding IclR family transcriptional regulator
MSIAHDRTRGALGVQSIEVGLRLLRPLIDAGKPLNLKALADAAGFAAPKARRYLVSLIKAGLVEQDAHTGRYGFGSLSFELGLNALGLLDPDKVARATLAALEYEIGQSACLAVWRTTGPTVLAVEPSPQLGSVFVAMRVGSTLPLILSGSGQIFLAFLPRDTTGAIVAKECRTFRKAAGNVDQVIEQVRRRGYAMSKDATVPGISAISAPVFNHDGRLAYALTSFGPTASLDTTPKGAVVPTLRAKADALSARIGFRRTHQNGR